MAGVTFTADGARRIRDAVRKVEATPQNRIGDRSQSWEGATEFWAILRGMDLDGRWSFMRVRPDPKALLPHFTLSGDPWPWVIEGEMFWDAATEANGNKAAPLNLLVKVSFVGYDRDGNPRFVFYYPPPEPSILIPPHQHTSNFDGGFAFAIFHPGTSLPQQPWAI